MIADIFSTPLFGPIIFVSGRWWKIGYSLQQLLKNKLSGGQFSLTFIDVDSSYYNSSPAVADIGRVNLEFISSSSHVIYT